MGNFQCLKQRQDLIDFQQLEELDQELAVQIKQLRKENHFDIQSATNVNSRQSIYRGGIKNKERDGYGELFAAGHIFAGYFQKNLPEGYGIIIKNYEEYYRGEFINGKYHGKGRQFSNLHEFQGQYENGFRKKGILRTNSFQYHGQFQDNLFDGKGIINFSIGNSYEGYFKKGSYNGVGLLTINNNAFSGTFKNGKYDGQGIFTWSDGTKSLGNYSEGRIIHRQLIKQNKKTNEKVNKELNKKQWFQGIPDHPQEPNPQKPQVIRGNGFLQFF